MEHVEKPVTEGIVRAAERAGIARSGRHATSNEVQLTIPIAFVHDLFSAGNWGSSEGDPLDFSFNVIEHAAQTLDLIHDALHGTEGDIDDIASHAWRVSIQLLAGIEVARSLQGARGAR